VREAEFSKLLEYSYRLINISFINELARLCGRLQLDFNEILRLAATKPFGYQAFNPSSGVGGHCIPVDPVFLQNFLTSRLDGDLSNILKASINSNRESAGILAHRIKDILTSLNIETRDSMLVLIGVTYKKDSSDLRESSALKLVGELISLGFKLCYLDPYVEQEKINLKKLTFNELLDYSYTNKIISIITQIHSNVDFDGISEVSELVFEPTHNLV
jgi:nucleotide sugar dehydrogenase